MTFILIFAALAVLTGVMLAVSYWTYTVAFRSSDKTQENYYNIPRQ